MNKKSRLAEVIADIVKPGRPLRDAALLFAVFYLVYILNSSSLRLVWMDWCYFNDYRAMHAWPDFRRIVTNEWVQAPRVFFLTLMLQALTQKCFGYWAAPHFVLSFGAHFVSAMLIGRMTRKATANMDVGRAAAVLCLVIPTSAGALFIINTSIYVLSFSAAVLTAYLVMFPRKNSWADLLAITGAALSCQFLGEQTIPLLYWTLVCFGLREARLGGWRRCLLRTGVPLAACAASLLVYYFLAVKPYAQNFPLQLSSSVASEFVKKFFVIHLEALNFTSWMYGKLSLPPSSGTFFIALPLVFVLWLLFFRAEAEAEAEMVPAENVWPAVIFLAAGLAATFVPVLYSALTGYRTAIETRYLYCSGLLIATILPFLFELLSRQWSEQSRSRVRKYFFVAVSSYLGILMVYDFRDIWGAQKEVDQRIWAQVDANFNPQVKFVATDGLQYATLLPITRSNAVSDFHEEFGVRCRIKTVHGVEITPVRRPDGESGDIVSVAPYRSMPQPVKKTELLTIVFRYEKRYRDLLHGKLIVFPDFDDYVRYRKSEPFDFK